MRHDSLMNKTTHCDHAGAGRRRFDRRKPLCCSARSDFTLNPSSMRPEEVQVHKSSRYAGCKLEQLRYANRQAMLAAVGFKSIPTRTRFLAPQRLTTIGRSRLRVTI